MLVTIGIEESYKIISDIIYGKIDEFANSISGYFFNVFSLTSQTRHNIFNQFYEKYPEDEKLKMLESDGNPVSVLENLILNGIDMFESRYPIAISEENLCLNFQTEMPSDYTNEENKEVFSAERLLSITKTPKRINLIGEEYKKDSGILTEGCTCPACKSINRAYIHHLIDCKEMNATILLTLHNLHVYDNFFKAIRQHIEAGTLLEYAEWFLNTQCE